MDDANDVAPFALLETTQPRPPTTAFGDEYVMRWQFMERGMLMAPTGLLCWTLLPTRRTQLSPALSRLPLKRRLRSRSLPTTDDVPPIPALALHPVGPSPSAARSLMANEAQQHVKAWCAVSAAHAGYDAMRRHSLEVLRDVTIRFIETMGANLVHETEKCARALDGAHSSTAMAKACALAAGRVMQQVNCPPTALRAHLVETIQYGSHLRQANDAVRKHLLRDPSSTTAGSEPLYEALSGILDGVRAGTAEFAPLPRAGLAMPTLHALPTKTNTSSACSMKRPASATAPRPMKKQQSLAPANVLRSECIAAIATGSSTLTISDLDVTDLGDFFATDQLPLEPFLPSPSPLL
ncbi:hypothetical protein, variant [Saprolegnia diclina VS20]|uniref:Uncharacterized protein n=1 Tax=Saprolegnia diclina (strain VS20) TaxID=1156394 RepID=T0PXH4_SAPDV|nr:hypothetical protein, variant [Saprolegnia diclina VS20]EQC26941.1 hypothetical protein, variant [Saprolegnia diclina VS20]|eukprot:XP_008619662.1 hypothetical protein, variant [Saprolegnia diclina VS20]